MVKKLDKLRFKLAPQSTYSPYLAISDFHLSPKLRLLVAGKRFKRDEEFTAEVEQYFDVFNVDDYETGIMVLHNGTTGPR